MEAMRYIPAVLLIATLGAPLANAQVGRTDPTPFVPRYTVALGYQHIRANDPPATCDCFGLNGGFISGTVALRYWLRVAAEVTGSHANNIGPLGQNLNLITYTGGPQIVLHPGRFETYGQFLVGAAHGSDSYFPSSTTFSTSANSFAYNAGGGIDFNVSHSIAVRAVEVQYLHTGFPNGTNGSQNHLMIGAGIVLRLHSRPWTRDPHGERAKADKAMRGADRHTEPEITTAPRTQTSAGSPTAPGADTTMPTVDNGGSFKDEVKDAYFDYDSSELREDARAALIGDAAYLKAHPNLHVVVGGYADERGSAEYNLALSEKRAQIARDQLIANGVSPDQLEVVSYGKERPTCAEETESCFQLNRRAGLELRSQH